MRMMGAFLRERKREVWLGVVLIGTFACVSYLYRVRMDAVTYALMLSAVFCLLFGVPDFLRFVRKHRELVEVESGFLSGFAKIPECETLLEEDYQRILSKFYEALLETDSAGRIARQEMVDYYGMWAHQIKTPIAAMHVLLQALEGCEFEEDVEDVDESLTSVEGCEFEDGGGPLVSVRGFTKEMKLELFKIEQYAEMALYFARLDSLSSDFLFRKYDVQEIVKQAVKKYSVLFLHSGLSFRMEEFEIKAVTDEKWLCFVVEQVFSNALKYTPEGGIAIYGANEEGGEIRGRASYLVIEDTGIGIRESDLPRIFERGFTGYNGRMDKRSTGLGLYLCEQIMKRMSHTITVKSAQGKGTKVILGFMREM